MHELAGGVVVMNVRVHGAAGAYVFADSHAQAGVIEVGGVGLIGGDNGALLDEIAAGVKM